MVRDGKPTSFEIMINEEQRLALLALIHKDGGDDAFADTPLEYWEAMLKGLPENELESPGTMHGFCL